MVSQGDGPSDRQPDPYLQGRVLAVQGRGKLGRVSRHLPMMVAKILDWLCYYCRHGDSMASMPSSYRQRLPLPTVENVQKKLQMTGGVVTSSCPRWLVRSANWLTEPRIGRDAFSPAVLVR